MLRQMCWMFLIPASWQTRDVKNELILETGREILPREFLPLWTAYCKYQDLKISLRKFLVFISATDADHRRRNFLGQISLPVFKNSSFFTSLVCHEAGIRNIIYICLNSHWSRPFWSGITKYKSKKSYNICFEFRSELRSMKHMFCSPLTPLHPFLYYLLLDRGNQTKAAKLSECFGCTNVTKFLPWN